MAPKRLTPAQRKALRQLSERPKNGFEQSLLRGPEWRMFDRLVGKALAEKRFVTMTGPVYHITAAGIAALTEG